MKYSFISILTVQTWYNWSLNSCLRAFKCNISYDIDIQNDNYERRNNLLIVHILQFIVQFMVLHYIIFYINEYANSSSAAKSISMNFSKIYSFLAFILFWCIIKQSKINILWRKMSYFGQTYVVNRLTC